MFLPGGSLSLSGRAPLDRYPLDRDSLEGDPRTEAPRMVKSDQCSSYLNEFLYFTQFLSVVQYVLQSGPVEGGCRNVKKMKKGVNTM